MPRRESTARDDYDLIEGVNRHTIGPFGWVHEQDNLKQVLGADIDAPKASRARELGVNRYDRVIGFDFSAADDYWRATAPFWSIVRDAWSDRLASATTLEVATVCRDVPVFVHFFQYAQKLEAGEAPASSEMQAFVDDIIDCIVTS